MADFENRESPVYHERPTGDEVLPDWFKNGRTAVCEALESGEKERVEKVVQEFTENIENFLGDMLSLGFEGVIRKSGLNKEAVMDALRQIEEMLRDQAAK